MPDKRTIERARKDKREGKSVSTQAGEFVREEIDIIRKGFHGARSAKQAIAIGLSKAERSASAKKAVRTKGPKELSEAVKKAAMTRALTSKNGNGNEPPVKPEKNNPAKPDTNPDPTKRRPGVNEPEKIDPTRIEPEKTEPTPPETPPSK